MDRTQLFAPLAVLAALFALAGSGCASSPAAPDLATYDFDEVQRSPAGTRSPAQHRAEKLAQAGLSPDFVDTLNAAYARQVRLHGDEETARIIELNVLGFMGKADYTGHFSPRAVRKCRKFLLANRTALLRAEKRFGVQKEVIAALLWVETQHGTHMGKFNIASVFLSLVEADHPLRMKATYEAALGRTPAAAQGLKEKVVERSRSKAAWAQSQLKSLEQMQRMGAKGIRGLRGSYAGAFGIPQFVPSSYVEWASAFKAGTRANLFKAQDAITSVASYLSAQGWKKIDGATYRPAIYHYNRADGYVDVILKIAGELSGKNSRLAKPTAVVSKET